MQDCIAGLERTLDVVETDTARAWLDVDLVHARRRATRVDADDTEDEPSLLRSMPPFITALSSPNEHELSTAHPLLGAHPSLPDERGMTRIDAGVGGIIA
jgi:hypothetical protein